MRIPSTRLRRYNGTIGALAIVLFGLLPRALALNLGFGDWQAHGFLSQGYTYTSGNDFFGNSQGDGSLDFTELGLNVLGHPWPNLLIAAQGVYRNAVGSDQEAFRLDYANLDYHLPLGEAVTLGVRLGRVKNPIGLYNETRDVIWTGQACCCPSPSISTLWLFVRPRSPPTAASCTAVIALGSTPLARSSSSPSRSIIRAVLLRS